MIRLLVVDDFEADREEITTIVGSFAEELDIEIVGECDNGIAATEAMGSLRPDIVLSDIQMPYMDGFQLAEHTQSRYPDISFVFLSLYGDVEHLKGAIDLNCNGYIIKPVDPRELRACLERQIERSTEQQKLVSEYRELRRLVRDSTPFIIDGLVRDLLAGRIAGQAELAEKFCYFGVGIPLANLRVCVVEIDGLDRVEEDVEARQIRVMNINRLASSGLAAAGRPPLFRLDDTHMVYFLPCGAADPRGEEPFLEALEAAEAVVGAVRKGGFSVTLAVSDVCGGPEDMPRMYEQCLYMLRFKYSLGKGRVILPEEIPGSVAGQDIDFNALQKDLRFVLNSLEEDAVTAFADHVFSGQVVERRNHLNAAVAVFLQVYLEENGIQREEVFREGDGFERYLGLETIEDSKRWLAATLEVIRGHILSRNRNKGRFMVGRIKEFIHTRPVEELTLERIASHFYYSPNYINSLFKRETGGTISDYVTACKLRRAKELLGDPGKTVASVAAALGYSHVSYFNYVFKRNLGMTPKEYREGRACRLG